MPPDKIRGAGPRDEGAVAADERATQNVVRPFVRGLPEDPAVGKLKAADPALRGSALRIVAIVVLAAVALWLVLS